MHMKKSRQKYLFIAGMFKFFGGLILSGGHNSYGYTFYSNTYVRATRATKI